MKRVHESLDRRHVELLVAIDQTGQLGRAADLLNLSPSAASHRLKEAERRLGVSLTSVDGRSIRLTPAARHLAEIGAASHRALRAAEETARWMSTAARPAVRIALDFYDTAPWFERLIGQSDLPCDVDFIRVGYDEVGAAVSSRRADLGVVVSPVGQQLLSGAEPIAGDVLIGVVRGDHPAAKRGRLDPADVADATYVTAGDRPSHGFEHHEFFEPAGVRPLRLRKVESLAMILRLIRTFGGVTVQPALSLRTAILDDLAVVPLQDVEIRVEWSVLLRSEPTDNEREMADAIRTLCASDSPATGPESETVPEWAGP